MRERGIHIRPPEPDESLRFHPRCPYGTDAYPCMLALVRNTLTDKPQAVVRTALSSCGEKIERMSYGPTGGGAMAVVD